MSMIEIRDHSLWPKHIVGNDALKAKLLSLAPGEIVILKIGGVSGCWVRMEQGKNPTPTEGLKPACDTTRMWWHEQQVRRGQSVAISEVRP